ncbi:unnamed protein product [Amaranthus hypochondriacus]
MEELTLIQLPITPILSINNILYDSLLVEILQRLPYISILRAKSVCKHWSSIISDPYFLLAFVRYHDQHVLPFTLVYEFHFWHRYFTDYLNHKLHIVSEHSIFQSRGFDLSFLPCFRPHELCPIWVVASYKDLLVCCHLKMSSLQGVYYICNPLTRQWLALPPALGHHRVACTAIGLITFENYVTRNSFKLVQVPELNSCPSTHNCFEVNVFCSDLGEWRKFEIISTRDFTRTWQFRPESITFENKFHWLVNSTNVVVLDPSELSAGSCYVIDLPNGLNPNIGICLGTCRDYLTVCQLTRGHTDCVLGIWKLVNYGVGKWEMECGISLKEMVLNELRFSSMEVLAFHPSNLRILYLRFDNRIVMCDIERRIVQVISELLPDSNISVGTCSVFPLKHPCCPTQIPSLSTK